MSFFSKLGSIVKTAAPYIQQIGNSLVGAGGSPEQLQQLGASNELALRRQQLGMQQQLQQSQLQSQDLQRQLEQKQIENIRTPEEIAAANLANQRVSLTQQRELAPPQDLVAPTDTGQMGHFQRTFNPQTSQYEVSPTMMNKEVPNPTQAPGAGMVPPVGGQHLLPPSPTVTSRQQLMAMPKAAGQGMTVADPNSSTGYAMEHYDMLGNVISHIPNAPPPAHPIAGFGSVDPLIGGQVGPMPNPTSYKGGLKDPQFNQDLASWSKKAADIKQQRDLAIAQARGAAYGENRPVQAYDPSNEAAVITTMKKGVPGQAPGSPLLSANQSGVLNLAQKGATFGELDKNISNVTGAAPILDKASTLDRAAMAAALTPGRTKVGQMMEGTALNTLSPEQKQLIFSIRNLRQGALSLRNVLTSGGVGSDYRVQLLEAEMPNEQDLMGDSASFLQKLNTFNSIYGEIRQAYPDLVTKASQRGGLKPPSGGGNTKPPVNSVPPANPSASKVLVEGKDF